MTEPHRPRAPSLSDAWDALTDTHTLGSSPPSVEHFDRWVGYKLRRVSRWVARTAWGTTVSSLVAMALGFLARHLLHLVHGLRAHGW